MGRSKLQHEKFMRLALRLAQKGKGKTNPNPLVGAVVVKNGRILGQGYHQAAGMPHAETIALDKAGSAARGGRLYVTLEPCQHFGQTPPCVDKILASGIQEVVFAMNDPNPLNSGRGAEYLRRHKIKVLSGILAKEAREINQVFIKYITKKLPFVTVKVAQSLDGKIATASGDSRWISSPSSRRIVHKLRSQVDAILVGVDTILIDNPLLTARLNGHLRKRQPKKVIVDSRLKLSANLKIFSPRSPAQVIIATTKLAPQERIAYFSKRARVIMVKDKEKRVDLRDLLRAMARLGIAHILIEGGGEIIASAIKKGLVDRMIVFVSTKIIGGRDAPTAVEGEGVDSIRGAIKLEELKTRRLGTDLMLEARVK